MQKKMLKKNNKQKLGSELALKNQGAQGKKIQQPSLTLKQQDIKEVTSYTYLVSEATKLEDPP